MYQKFKKDFKSKPIPGKQLVQNRYSVGKQTALNFIKRLKEERDGGAITEERAGAG
jgi:hypothetical protein